MLSETLITLRLSTVAKSSMVKSSVGLKNLGFSSIAGAVVNGNEAPSPSESVSSGAAEAVKNAQTDSYVQALIGFIRLEKVLIADKAPYFYAVLFGVQSIALRKNFRTVNLCQSLCTAAAVGLQNKPSVNKILKGNIRIA